MFSRWFWPLAWPCLLVHSLPKTPLLMPLKAQKLLLKALWKPLKALPLQLVMPLPPLVTLLLPVQTLLLLPLVMPLLPLAQLLTLLRKPPSKLNRL